MSVQKKYPQIEQVKDQLVNSALLFGAILGFFTYALSITRLFTTGFEFSFVSDLFVLIVIVAIYFYRNKIALPIKSYVILGAIYLLMMVDIVKLGVFSADKVLIILIPFAALMSFSIRRTIQISSLAILSIIVIAYFHLNGTLIPPSQDNITVAAWLINILLLVLVTIIIFIIQLKFNSTYSSVIADLEQSNRMISEKERNYREIFNSSTDAIFIHDLDGRILDVNESMLQMYGYDASDIPRISIADLSSQANGFKLDDARKYFLRVNDNVSQVFDWQAKHKNGDFFWVEVALKKTTIAGNDRILAIVRDINAKKEDALQLNLYRNHLEELVTTRTVDLKRTNEELEFTMKELKEAQSQLIQTEKMASLGVLTAGVAHEINNPLNYIMGGYVGLDNYFADKGEIDNKNIPILLSSIKIGIDRASGIVNALGQFSRGNNSISEICDIHNIIDNSLVMLQSQFKNRIDITKKYTSNSTLLRGNVGKLHQVFNNILTNSIQAIENCGSISIFTYNIDNSLCIEIADTGYGISEENISKITDPFFTTKEPGAGTGLGLSIVYSIIQEHNGELDFKSEVNKGTTVKIKLPIKS